MDILHANDPRHKMFARYGFQRSTPVRENWLGKLRALEFDWFRHLAGSGYRSFGKPWEGSSAGAGGELIMADMLDGAIRTCARSLGQCSSAMLVGLDLGKPGAPYFALEGSNMPTLQGFGGDIDLALFVRESARAPVTKYGNGVFRRLTQDHLILIDSKQYNGNWDLTQEFARKVQLVRWMRKMLSSNVMLGTGSDPSQLRISYHFAMTGDYAPNSWMSRVGTGRAGLETPFHVTTGTQWWNYEDDIIMVSPAEVITGQASMLILNNNQDNFRDAVPQSLFQMLQPGSQAPYAGN